MSNKTTSAKVFAISAFIFTPIAGVAQTAPTIDGTVSISTTTIDVEGSNYRLNALNVVSDINFSDSFSIGLDLDNGRQSISDDITVNLKRFQIEPTWTFENGAYVGAYFQTASTDITFISVTLDNVGVFGGYAQESWSVDAYFGETSTGIGISAETEARNAGLTFSANPTQKLELFGHYARAEIEDSGDTGEISLSALGAEYAFDNGIMTYAAAGTFEADFLGDTTLKHLAIGTGAKLSAIGLKAPGMLTLELARTDGDFGIEQNQVTLGWVFGIGNGNATPLNGIARIARGGIRGPFVGGIGAFGLGEGLSLD